MNSLNDWWIIILFGHKYVNVGLLDNMSIKGGAVEDFSQSSRIVGKDMDYIFNENRDESRLFFYMWKLD